MSTAQEILLTIQAAQRRLGPVVQQSQYLLNGWIRGVMWRVWLEQDTLHAPLRLTYDGPRRQ